MLFNSLTYLLFLPSVVIIFFLLPRKAKKIFLLLASLFFYSCWNVKYTFLMVFSIVITYLTGIYLDKHIDDERKKKKAVFICFAINLGILFFFKYFNFALNSLNDILAIFHIHSIGRYLNFLLPVGISFYTFQALGYTIDVYRKDIKAEKNFINYALFVSFFPQLVAGPIERSTNLLPQIKKNRKFSYDNMVIGLIFITYGYFLKLVIADRAAIVVNGVFNSIESYSSLVLFFAAFLFTIQIYCDFYSYSIIAKGSAKILGVDLMDNFKEPFFSKSIVEFWSRWHISLSSWFKDYLYIPLGGNRKGKFRKYINLLIVFTASGLWHGAELSFIVWGFINGLLIIFENITGIHKKKTGMLLNTLRIIATYLAFIFTTIFFRASTTMDAILFIKNIFTFDFSKYDFNSSLIALKFSNNELLVLVISILILFLVDFLKYKGIKPINTLKNIYLPIRWIIYLFFIFGILIFGIYGPGFSESQFIYFQF
ncbi:MBOAT family O-acyltransferase [Peptoniphilus lacrimalis]|uniref:MBOAT family O-acyltransferase n=1 Tax=Peptoniphilus lacrimalis TaxID=33031 RepID=UPI0023F9DBCD|nr:MBOAT family O-acyltransferase [Peptoniphilus lacrimalis]